ERRRVLGLLEGPQLSIFGAGLSHGKLQPPSLHGQRDRLRGGPGPGPVGRRDRDAQTVAHLEGMRDDVERHRDLVAAPRLERLRALVALAVGQIQDSTRDEKGRAVRRDVAEAYGDERQRPVDLQLEYHLRMAED